MSLEDTEWGGGHGGELIYHRDTENTEFRIGRKKEGGGPAVNDRGHRPREGTRLLYLLFDPYFFPELRVLCVSVVNQFPSASSSPLRALLNME
jgi:hypothetical protein